MLGAIDLLKCREWSAPPEASDNFRRPRRVARPYTHAHTPARASRDGKRWRERLFAVVLVVDVAADARGNELRIDAVAVHVGDRLQDEPVILRVTGPRRP